VGDASLLAKLYANRLAYDHAEKIWYLWNGYHWHTDTRKQVVNLVAGRVAAQYLRAAAEIQAEIKMDDDEAKKAQKQQAVKELSKRAGALRFRSKIQNILVLAASQPTLALSGEEWEPNPMLLAVSNGIIDLTTGHFRTGRPADYIRTAVPTLWQGLNAPAPRWERFLEEIFPGDSELVNFMQRLLGYAITGNATEHILPIFWGNGRNGKDTFLETLRAVLGPVAASVERRDD
jgi:putative DNA primase/helicase